MDGSAPGVPPCPAPTGLGDTRHGLSVAACSLGPKPAKLKQCRFDGKHQRAVQFCIRIGLLLADGYPAEPGTDCHMSAVR